MLHFKNSFKTTKKRLWLLWDVGTVLLTELGFLLLLKHLWLRPKFEGWEKRIFVKHMCLFHFILLQLLQTCFCSVRFYPKYIAPMYWT